MTLLCGHIVRMHTHMCHVEISCIRELALVILHFCTFCTKKPVNADDRSEEGNSIKAQLTERYRAILLRFNPRFADKYMN